MGKLTHEAASGGARGDQGRWRGWRVNLLLLGAMVVLCGPGGLAAEPFSGELDLTLRKALFQKPEQAADGVHLHLHFEARDGQWQRVWGKAQNYGIGEHIGIVESAEVTDTAVRLKVTILIQSDFWVKTQWIARYEINATRQPNGAVTGTYTGVLKGVDLKGQVEGVIPAARPMRKGFVPPAPDEHPRVLLRKGDLPALREKLKTPLGQAYLKRAGESGDMINLGLLYQLTGDKAHAVRAMEAINEKYKDAIPVFGFGSGGFGHDIFAAALAYDLCYDAWPEDFRAKLRLQFEEFTERQQHVLMTSHANFHPCSNYYGPGRGVPGVVAMILWGDKGAAPPKPRDPLARPWPILPPQGFTPGKGVPTTELDIDKTPSKWIWSGPLPFECSRDVLTGMGGYSAARPEVGTTANYTVKTEKWFKQGALEFKELPEEVANEEGIDLEKALGKQEPAVAVFYTAAKVKAQRTVSLVRESPQMKVWISGVELEDRVFYKLEPGLHPVLVEMRMRQPQGTVGLRLASAEEDDPQGALELARFEKRLWEQDQAMWEKTGMAPVRQLWLDRGWFQNYQHYRWGMGDGGTQTETGGYAQISSWYPSVYASMYPNFFGRSATAYPDVTHLIPRKIMQSVFTEATGPGKRRGNKPQAQQLNSVITLNPQWMACHFPIIPDQYKASALWVWNYLCGVTDEKSIPNVLGGKDASIWGLGGLTLAQTFLHYPLDLKPVHPDKGMPRQWSAGTFGLHVFRSGFEGKDEFVSQVWGKSSPIHGWNHPNAGAFQVWGLGRPWTWTDSSPGTIRDTYSVVLLPDDQINQGACGRLVHYEAMADGSGSLTLDMDDVYARPSPGLYDKMLNRNPEKRVASGITGLRAVAVDYSGKCGAPAMMVLVDKIDGGGKRLWTWQKPEGASQGIDGNTFTIRYPDAMMKATFVTPGDARIDYADDEKKEGGDPKHGFWGTLHRFKVESDGSFFVVATFQRGEAPKVSVEGSGLDAKVTVGGRKVRFDGRRIVLGE